MNELSSQCRYMDFLEDLLSSLLLSSESPQVHHTIFFFKSNVRINIIKSPKLSVLDAAILSESLGGRDSVMMWILTVEQHE